MQRKCKCYLFQIGVYFHLKRKEIVIIETYMWTAHCYYFTLRFLYYVVVQEFD